MVAIKCPNCGKQFEVPQSLLGKKGRCGSCQFVFPLRGAACQAEPLPSSCAGDSENRSSESVEVDSISSAQPRDTSASNDSVDRPRSSASKAGISPAAIALMVSAGPLALAIYVSILFPCVGYILLFAVILVAGVALAASFEAGMTPDQRNTVEWGPSNTAMICPHCQTKGQVRTKAVKRKKGVSGGKATAAVLTGGTSLLVTGLSRKEDLTQAHCMKCNSTWDF